MIISAPDSQITPKPEFEAPALANVKPRRIFLGGNFVFAHPAFIAFGGGVGLSRFAPGTMATLLALSLFWLINQHLNPIQFLLLTGTMFVIGIWACGVTGKALGDHDHGGMVWDEIVAFLLVLFFTPQTLIWQAFAFLLFRLFDILKPPPIRYYDKKLRGVLA